jgi:GTPase SAR1 family protein
LGPAGEENSQLWQKAIIKEKKTRYSFNSALNNRNSFYNLRNWLNSIKDNTNKEKIQLIIIANKSDLVDEREVSTDEIAKKARELDVEYFERIIVILRRLLIL